MNADTLWLALVIGNTRLHWAAFMADQLKGTWHTRHLKPSDVSLLVRKSFAPACWTQLGVSTVPDVLASIELPQFIDGLPLYVASVVPAQAALWQLYPGLKTIALPQIPLENLYPTMGIDRALNLLGAGDRYGWPVLVIDAGTALTFTAGAAGRFVGGAILPGLALQFKALAAETAALPTVDVGESLPDRWAMTTPEAIRSGIWHGILGTIQDFVADWRRRYPQGAIVLTGGDGAQLLNALTKVTNQKEHLDDLHQDAHLAFLGLNRCRQDQV